MEIQLLQQQFDAADVEVIWRIRTSPYYHHDFLAWQHGCYLLSMRWFSLEEERVMQQSSVSLSF